MNYYTAKSHCLIPLIYLLCFFLATFYILMGMSGVFQAMYYGSMYGCCMEVTSPSKAPYTYMVESFFDGCGSIIAPSITGW